MDGAWVLVLRVSDDGRLWHHARLQPDAAQAVVYVVEDLGAAGASPDSADEASLRGPGEPAWDPARPRARMVSSRVRQTTTVDPERMAELPLELDGDRVLPPSRWPDGVRTGAADQRGEWLVTLIAAVVTCSGWVWQPRLLRC